MQLNSGLFQSWRLGQISLSLDTDVWCPVLLGYVVASLTLTH